MKTTLLNNRYRVLEILGRGGFGQTFLAVDTHMPSGRKCVIKQLHPSVQEPKMQQWVQTSFQKEAAILEELGEGHRQIPRLYAYFSEAENFYLVQEWINGLTLQQLRQRGTLSEEKVREILIGILEVLDYVHGCRILHRDIKPDNVILRVADEKPVLIDFGAVKEAIATVVDPQGNTRLSFAVGTPGYMSSEQAAGRPMFSSDLYSLGLTAVYLLTGKSPQELETDSRTGEILWRRYAPKLHANLATVIDRAVRFHPRDRFASAREMLDALRQPNTTAVPTKVVSPQPATAPSTKNLQKNYIPPRREYAPPPKQRNWLGWILVLLFAGIAGIAFAIGFNIFSGRERSPSIVESPQPEETPSSTPETPSSQQPTPTPEPPEEDITPPPVEIPVPEPEQPTSAPEPINLPGFVIGTPQEQIVSVLGQPTVERKGYWQNSRAWLYRNAVPQVDLGYVFDADTNRLRQTEVSFAPTVELEAMQTTLNQLLGGNVPPAAAEGLANIYQRENDLRSFEVGNLEGIIQRNNQDRIYIGVWDADFH